MFDASTSQDFDNWDDIALEREALKDEAIANKILQNDDKYGALVNFNKLAQEEAQKVKDQRLLKQMDIAKKFENIQMIQSPTVPKKSIIFSRKGGPVILEEEKIYESPKKSMFMESSKEIIFHEEPTEKLKNNFEQFEQKFPMTNLLTRRRSIDYKPDITLPARRKHSLIDITTGNALKYLTVFRYGLDDKINKEKLDRILNNLTDDVLKDSPKPKKIKNRASLENKFKKIMKFGPWDELWEYKQEIIKEKSAYGHFPSYKLRSLIIKGDDDLRQELIAMQLIRKMEKIWRNAGLTLSLRSYDILVTSEDSGILGNLIC